MDEAAAGPGATPGTQKPEGSKWGGPLEYEMNREVSRMNTAGQVAVVAVVLALIAGGNAVVWVWLFRQAAKTEPPAGSSTHSGRSA